MIKQRLNHSLIDEKLKSSGLNHSDLAKKLDISRESVSQWLSGDNFPRSRYLLAISKLLNLSYSELVFEEPDENEPVYAFRKVHDTVHSEQDIEKVKEIGYSLEKLIPFIKTSRYKATLSNPRNTINYIQDIVKDLKNNYGIKSKFIKVDEIQKIFNDYNAFVIPVLWGETENKTNSLHIRLPESGTDWIYINLDSFIYDIKFWLIHELSHLISSEIKDESESESFADNFAAEFLFPLDEAKILFKSLQSTRTEDILPKLFEKAVELLISPYTIYRQLIKYMDSIHLERIDIPKIVDTFKEYLPIDKNITFTEYYLKRKSPEPEEYINLIEKSFSSDFIKALLSYSNDERFSVGFVQNIFHISLLDAKSIYLVLKQRA
jgi:transcriptional regulator with XRE-family HTH domain